MKSARSTSTIGVLVFGLAMTSLAAEPRYSDEQTRANEQLKLVVQKLAALPEPDAQRSRPPQISAATFAALAGDPSLGEQRATDPFSKTYLFNIYMMAGETKIKLGDSDAGRALFDKAFALGKGIYRAGHTGGAHFRPAVAAMLGVGRDDLVDSLLALMPERGEAPGRVQAEIQQVAVECMVDMGQIERAGEMARKIPEGYFTGDSRRRALQSTADVAKAEIAIELYVAQLQTTSAFAMPGAEVMGVVGRLIEHKAFPRIVDIAEKIEGATDAGTDSLRRGIAQQLRGAGRDEEGERVEKLIKDPAPKGAVNRAAATTRAATTVTPSPLPTASSQPATSRPAATQPVPNAKELDEAMRLKWIGEFDAAVALLKALPSSPRRDTDLTTLANQLVENGRLELSLDAVQSLPIAAGRSAVYRSIATRAAVARKWALVWRCIELADPAEKRAVLERVAAIASSAHLRGFAKEWVKQADALPAAEDQTTGGVRLRPGDVAWVHLGLLARARVGDKRSVLESAAAAVSKLDPKRDTFRTHAYELALLQALAGADVNDLAWIEKLPQDVAVYAWSGAGEGYLERITGLPAEVRRYNYRQAGFN